MMAVPREVKRQIEFSDAEKAVLEAYKANPKSADNDKLLLLYVWRDEGLRELLADLFRPFCLWFQDKATNPDTITRAGRRLRQLDVISSSPEAERFRREQQKEYRRDYGQT